ncbi:DUF4138 domain-containing protein [Maribacter sp. 4G9]|uniref:DUF4138 domain-containing protein n=1 Tax=Maribacter sp. 4G9 TaxID=1889777 RepID=UPI000C15E5A5|nr:DUF4138 domain-containing protein [Maribacter sp. 4G9]PIB38311.1 hypothetical protein BFP75_17145 [Maribacter sp. 4G9]
MKHIFLIFLLSILGNIAFAQESQQLDTIYANEKMNLALFFPTNIRQGIVGANNFVFSYNRERAQPLGLLKATKGKQSNLLVVTTDGKVYSYIIKYADSLKELNRFVSFSESIGHEHQREPLVIRDTIQLDSNMVVHKQYPKTFLEKSSTAILKQSERKNISKRKDGMSLAIKNLVYYEDLVFMQFEIKNESGIDFDIDYLKVALVIGNEKRRASYQSVPLKPQYVYKMPEKTRHAETSRFVYVLPKFTLGDNEKLELRLKELKGNREMILRRRL